MTQPRVVILCPRREGFPDRDLNWAWVRNWWQTQFPEWEVFEGESTLGLFNRSMAINRAAGLADWQRSQRWDVAIIIDADVICDAKLVPDAVNMAWNDGRMVMPFNVRYDLNEEGSRKVMDGFTGSWRPWIRHTYNNMVSSVNIVSRNLWDDTGGFDESFTGWGFEDNAFAISCRTFGRGNEVRMKGDVWHLYHRTAVEGRKGSEVRERNKRRADHYLRNQGNKEAIRALRDTAPPSFEHRPSGIPRIIHRTIPAQSHPVADEYWAGWQRLHPDWDMMTHQDPLDPAYWPETAHAWSQCTSGAQRAGLIRLEALWRWGGIYLDHDVSPCRSLEPLLPLSAFAAWEDDNCIPDAVIGAVPGHPAIRKCLDLALARLNKGPWESGPGVTTEVFRSHPDTIALAPGSFYPVHYRDPNRESIMEHPDTQPWTYGVHRYWGSWLEPERQRVPT